MNSYRDYIHYMSIAVELRRMSAREEFASYTNLPHYLHYQENDSDVLSNIPIHHDQHTPL